MQVHSFARFSHLVRGSTVQQSLKRSLLQRALLRISNGLAGFFFGSATDSVQDNLVEVVRQNPVAACGLLRCVSWYSAIGNIISATSCTVFLCLYWTECASCDRPLRWWLVLQSLLQVIQLPVRLVLLHTIRHGEESGDLQEHIASLTSSQAWQMSKKVAVFQYAWFVLGMVWWVHTDECPECPSISKLMAAVMAMSIGRASLAVCVFRALFGTGEAPDKAPAAVKATHSQIAALPTFHYKRCCSSDESQEPCSICLSGFGEGVHMRRLPCGHQFHRQCIDKWLRRNKRCPLCMRAIDESTKLDPNESCR